MIPPSGTFEYQAAFTKESFGDSEIVLQGAAQRGETEERLVGLNPKIRFWRDRLVLVATEKSKPSMRNASFPIGDAVNLAARPGDRLYLVLTGAGGIGLSLLRQERLVLALEPLQQFHLEGMCKQSDIQKAWTIGNTSPLTLLGWSFA